MKKLITLAAAAIIGACAFAEIVQVPLVKGTVDLAYPAKVIGIKAVSTNLSGTVTVKEIEMLATKATVTETVTNVTPKDATYRVADAFVNQRRVYTGSDATGWYKWDKVVTNVVGSVTNVVDLQLAKFYDGVTTNSLVYTNLNCSVRYRDVIAVAPVTNIVVTKRFVYTDKPMTNQLYTGTLSSGWLNAPTNLILVGGTAIDASGTAFVGGKAWLVLEK